MSENKSSFLAFQKNINTRQLLFESIRRWYIIVITLVVSVIIAFLYTKIYMTPLYSSTAKVMVFKKQTIQETPSANASANDLELSASSYLTRNFTELINDKFVLNDVAEKLDNKYTYPQLKSFISINNPTNTNVIEITATSPNAEDSQKIVSSICEVSQEKIVELMGLDRIQPFNYGEVPLKPSSPNLSKNMMTGGILGLIMSLSAIILIYITDNKVSSTEDVEKYLGMSVLATIPYNNKNKGRTSKRQYTASK